VLEPDFKLQKETVLLKKEQNLDAIQSASKHEPPLWVHSSPIMKTLILSEEVFFER